MATSEYSRPPEKDFRRYLDLAEEVFFNGMKPDRLNEIAEYIDGKTFSDFKIAAGEGTWRGAGRSFEHQIGCMAEEIKKVVKLRNVAQPK